MSLQNFEEEQKKREGQPYGWLQFKGINICMDVHCTCGELVHVDGEFCYNVQCGECGARYELSGFIDLIPIPADLPDPEQMLRAT